MNKLYKVIIIAGFSFFICNFVYADIGSPSDFVQDTFTNKETGDVDDDIPQNFIDSLNEMSFFTDSTEVAGDVCDLCAQSGDCGKVGPTELECVNGPTTNEAIAKCRKDKEGCGQCQIPGKVTLCSLSTHTDLEKLINEIMKWLLIFSLTLAPLMILLGGFYMLTAAGEPRRSTQGKTIITWAVIGLAVILFAKAFTSIITSILK